MRPWRIPVRYLPYLFTASSESSQNPHQCLSAFGPCRFAKADAPPTEQPRTRAQLRSETAVCSAIVPWLLAPSLKHLTPWSKLGPFISIITDHRPSSEQFIGINILLCEHRALYTGTYHHLPHLPPASHPTRAQPRGPRLARDSLC